MADALDYLEENRLKGRAITGKDLSKRFSSDEVKKGLTRQKKKITPDSNDEIMENQSGMRKLFSKGYK